MKASGIQLRRARKGAGLTQAELARKMGTSQPAIARAESGATEPTIGFIERLVVATGATLRFGDILIVPAPNLTRPGDRARRVRDAIGDYVFNPWDRDPSAAEARSLEADGLTREHFESARAPR